MMVTEDCTAWKSNKCPVGANSAHRRPSIVNTSASMVRVIAQHAMFPKPSKLQSSLYDGREESAVRIVPMTLAPQALLSAFMRVVDDPFDEILKLVARSRT